MEIKAIANKGINFLKKYRYLVLIIIIGFILLAIPSKSTVQSSTPVTVDVQEQETSIQQALSELLSKISGAGKVEVLLTFQAGEEHLYQTNENSNSGQDTTSKQVDTVTITDSEHNQTGLVRKTMAPTYRGAVVVCEGADDPSVQLAIVEAVSNATGLSTNRISVLKMK